MAISWFMLHVNKSFSESFKHYHTFKENKMKETGEIGEAYLISEGELINSDITFSVNNGEEMLKICADGSFYVKGKKVVEDIEVYKGFVEFLKSAGHYPEG
jgi:hypothetical protein